VKNLIKRIVILILKLLSNTKKTSIIDKTKIDSILVLAYTGIGNFILYTPALKLLRKEFPNAKITLQYGNSTGCELITQNSNIFDEYLELKREKSLLGYIKHALKNKAKYDLIISEFHNNNWKLAFELALLDTPYKVGHGSADDWKNNFDFLYNYPVKMGRFDHEILRYLKLLEPLDIDYSYEDEKLNTEVFVSYQNISNAQSYLDKLSKDKKAIGIQVGTSPTMRWKQWPLAKYKELIIKLQNDFNLVLIGSPSERQMIEDIVSDIDSKNIYIYAGDGSLLDASALISKLDMMITNDSGLMHIANAFDVKLIAIYGPTDFNRTAPLGKKSVVVRKDYECMPCFTMSGESEVVNCKYEYKCLVDIETDTIYTKIMEMTR